MPSKVQPQVISATGRPSITEIGKLPFKTYGSLIKREVKWFEDQANNKINSLLPLYRLAKKIAVDDNISDTEALTIVRNLGDEAYQDYAFRYLEDLGEIQKNKYSDSDFDGDIVTMVIQSRIPKVTLVSLSEMLFEHYDIQLDVDKGWLPDYTENLPMSVIDDIVRFVSDEKNRVSTDEDLGSDTEVTLGK